MSQDPELRCCPINLNDTKEWELPCAVLTAKAYVGMKHIARNLLLVAQSSIVERAGCAGSCPTFVVGHGKKAGEGVRNVRDLWEDSIRVSRNVFPREQWAPFGDVEKRISGVHIGPWEAKQPGLFSSGYGKASEHAVISSFPVSAVGGTNEPAVTSSFSAEVTAPSPCPLRNVTGTPESSGESPGTVTATRTAQRMSSAHLVPFVPSGVGLVLLSLCTSAERNGTVRRAGANPRRSMRAQREAKRKLVAQPEISHGYSQEPDSSQR